ncbi:hypothetical protein ACIOC1_12735 [Streptomyces sp. NPDC088197]|uniref:hypothetical protein n=1 Tax=Streptomyces sp. NPDC088197 TaxID=3365840 RepID=UPI0037FE7CA2
MSRRRTEGTRAGETGDGRARTARSRRLRSLTAAALVAMAAGGLALVSACDNSSGNSSTGATTPGAPPSTGNFSGTLPSPLDSLASAAQQTASAAQSSAKAAASSFEASVEAGAGSAAAEAKSELAKVDGQGNAVKDVQLTGFPKARTGGLNAVLVSITNTTDTKASFAVKVEFADSDGAVVDSTVVGARDVEPGKHAQPVAFSTKDADKTLFPRVAQAQRY